MSSLILPPVADLPMFSFHTGSWTWQEESIFLEVKTALPAGEGRGPAKKIRSHTRPTSFSFFLFFLRSGVAVLLVFFERRSFSEGREVGLPSSLSQWVGPTEECRDEKRNQTSENGEDAFPMDTSYIH